MPNIDKPDLRFGFWFTAGAILALVLLSLVRMLISRGRAASRSRP